jgi:hypothetical protein
MWLTCKFSCLLFTQPELLNQSAIPVDIFLLKVIQKTSPLSHQLNQASAGVVVFGVNLKMVGQVTDPLAQNGHLNLSGAGIRVMQTKPVNDVTLLFSV